MMATIKATPVRAGPKRDSLRWAASALAILSGMLPGLLGVAQISVRASLIPQQDLSSFVAGMLDIQTKRDDAAGVSVVVVQHDNTLLQQGYGMADVAKHIPMQPATMLRGGNLSNLFIAVSVLQQVERGHLSLDHDVSGYLDFNFPRRFGAPVTLRELLSQTAGFEASSHQRRTGNGWAANGCRASGAPERLRSFLVREMPEGVYPPGTVAARSDYGMAMAAYIVERTSGEPFAEYVERNIFLPLGMLHSTFQQPVSAALEKDMSRGYRASTRPPVSLEEPDPISRGLSTSAEDMGRFGQALLNGGALDGKRIVQPASVGQLWKRQFGPVAALPGMGLGFHQVWFNGLRFHGASGDTAAFHTEFDIDPDEQLILFVGYNSSGPAGRVRVFSRGEIVHGILDRYFPYHPSMRSPHLSDSSWKGMNAAWVSTARVQSNRFALLWLMRQYRTRISAKGTLRVDRFLSDRNTVKRWLPIAAGVWQQYPQDRVAVIRQGTGKSFILLAADPEIALERVAWFDDVRFVFATTIVCVLIVLLAMLRLRQAARAQVAEAMLPMVAAAFWIAAVASLAVIPFGLVQVGHLCCGRWADALSVMQSLLFLLAFCASLAAAILWVAKGGWRADGREARLLSVLAGLAVALLMALSLRWHLIAPMR